MSGMITMFKSWFCSAQLFKLLTFFTLLTASVSPALSQGNLLIYPRRVVFEGRGKVEKLMLSNTGKETAVYNISFLEIMKVQHLFQISLIHILKKSLHHRRDKEIK